MRDSNARILELSNAGSDGRRRVRVVLHALHEPGEWNENGITWLRDAVEPNLPSAAGASITCEFADEERTEPSGHGLTGERDGLPSFGAASVVGFIERAYAGELDGRAVVFAEGVIDSLRYGGFADELARRITDGEGVPGSVEIIGRPENGGEIRYRGGKTGEGRVPESYIYAGFAFLGVPPADAAAGLVEINACRRKKKPDAVENPEAPDEQNSADEPDMIGNPGMTDDPVTTDEPGTTDDPGASHEPDASDDREQDDPGLVAALRGRISELERENARYRLRECLERYAGDEPYLAGEEIEEYLRDPESSGFTPERITELIDARAYRRAFDAVFPMEN